MLWFFIVQELTVYEGLFTQTSTFMFVVVSFVIGTSAYTSVLLSVLPNNVILMVPLEAHLNGLLH